MQERSLNADATSLLEQFAQHRGSEERNAAKNRRSVPARAHTTVTTTLLLLLLLLPHVTSQ